MASSPAAKGRHSCWRLRRALDGWVVNKLSDIGWVLRHTPNGQPMKFGVRRGSMRFGIHRGRQGLLTLEIASAPAKKCRLLPPNPRNDRLSFTRKSLVSKRFLVRCVKIRSQAPPQRTFLSCKPRVVYPPCMEPDRATQKTSDIRDAFLVVREGNSWRDVFRLLAGPGDDDRKLRNDESHRSVRRAVQPQSLRALPQRPHVDFARPGEPQRNAG